jgi:hypothetical protein
MLMDTTGTTWPRNATDTDWRNAEGYLGLVSTSLEIRQRFRNLHPVKIDVEAYVWKTEKI